jgi:hypothetical protein
LSFSKSNGKFRVLHRAKKEYLLSVKVGEQTEEWKGPEPVRSPANSRSFGLTILLVRLLIL